MLIHSVSSGNKRLETYYYNYGNASTNPTERLLQVEYKLSPNTTKTLHAVYTYDDVGRVRTKQLANETSTYNYNVRNRLQILRTKFNQTLIYNTAVNGLTPAK